MVDRILFGSLGAVAGFCVGWVLAICWAACTGNLIMKETVYQEKKAAIELTIHVLVGLSTLIGGLIGALKRGGPGSNR